MKGASKSTSHRFFGERMTINEAIRRFGGQGVTYATFKKRYYDRMWGHEQAVTTPIGVAQPNVPRKPRAWELPQSTRNEILRRYCAGERPKDLAREFKVDSSYPSTLARRYGKPMHRTHSTVA